MLKVGVFSDRLEFWIGIISVLFQTGVEDEVAHFYELTPIFFLDYENIEEENDMDFIILDKKVFPEGVVDDILDNLGLSYMMPTTDMNLLLAKELEEFGYSVIIGENFCL